MADVLKVSGFPVPWDEAAADAFSSRWLAAGDDPLMGDDWYENEVNTGRLVLLRWVLADQSIVAHCALRREMGNGQMECCIVAATSQRPDLPVMETVLPLIEQFARDWGCVSMRFHTVRGGLEAKATKAGYGVSEIIMRKAL